MKLIPTIFLVTISFSLISQVTVTLNNKTGERVDSVFYGSHFCGTIEKDSSKTFIINNMSIDSGHPDEGAELILKGKKVKTRHFPKCGTSLGMINKGEYVFNLEINYSDYDKEYFLTVREKR